MTVPEIHKAVRERFSDAADTYAELCSVQLDVAKDLVERISFNEDMRILDVGAGRGTLASEIMKRCPSARMSALDSAERMVMLGRQRNGNMAWLQGDALALPLRSGSFDLVVSSSSYQWVADLPRAFSEARRVLDTNGRFYAVLFGHSTLMELFESLQAAGLARGREDVFYLRRLPSEEDVRAALRQADFRHRGVVREMREVSFRDLWSLFKWLKGIGANSLTRRFFLGGEFLAHVDEHYRERFSTPDGIRATFEVISLDAVK
jgi:malonyl-CoA O-methyltransferase